MLYILLSMAMLRLAILCSCHTQHAYYVRLPGGKREALAGLQATQIMYKRHPETAAVVASEALC